MTADLVYQMKRIRAVEETIAARYGEQKMRCPTHLSIGQEAAAVGVCAALERTDLAVSGHRAHAHYLAKGGDLKAMIAELHGKETGCARGKGGSMHLVDEAAGFVGSTAIVGGTIPVGAGLALAAKQRRTGQIVAIFFGDAAAEAGVFFETVNFALVRRLPVLFVCENNLYSVYSPLSVRQPQARRLFKMAEGLGLNAAHGDGNDVAAVHALARHAAAALRAGKGPHFLELSTYRWREHCGPLYDNDLGYRTVAEYEEWRERDPIPRAASALASHELAPMDARIAAEVEEAFAFAEASPFPAADGAGADVYAGGV